MSKYIKIELMNDSEVRVKLSEILKQLQGDKAMRKFAKDLKVSHVTLMSWLNCEGFPSRESLEKIANFRGQTLDDLMNELRGDRVVNTAPNKAEDLLILADNLSDSEAFRLATFLIDRVKGVVVEKLS